MGPPSREVEQAWNKLMFRKSSYGIGKLEILESMAKLIVTATPGHVHGFRLLRDEAKQLELNESALLKDNNFAVLLTIHHNLHCLVKLVPNSFTRQIYRCLLHLAEDSADILQGSLLSWMARKWAWGRDPRTQL
jgi:hypothetical protein